MTLFERLKLLANKQGKSINKVEEDLSLPRNSLYSWKKVTPAYERLSLVANYFGVSTDYLMNGETPKEIDEIIDTTTFDRIKELADRQGKSLQKVATDLEFSPNYFYNLKSKKSPSAEHLAKIADHFNVSVDYLLGREELKGEVLDDTEEQLIAAFRFEGKDLDEEGKERLNRSVQNLIRAARQNIQDSKKRKG